MCVGFDPTSHIRSFPSSVSHELDEKDAQKRDSTIRGDKWQLHTSRLRDGWQVSRHFRPWTGDPRNKLAGLPRTSRILDVVDCAWIKRIKDVGVADPEAARRGFYVDWNQAVQRSPWGTMSLCGGAFPYSFEGDFVLTGFDLCRILGCPRNIDLSDISMRQVSSLTSEAFVCPSAAVVSGAFLFNGDAPWWVAS